ncbi:hypothetical protein [Mammaliicoccus sciuri]|uniref:hypothetical protein n=1 Tax=Mammaliicoccus sciuri TaxID=1296 RepID=UPI000D1E31D5|nr:hypothetical protein [Mammaliicoccus sciuri]MCE5058980.1 hypothetical protein [Mammaliicoccus sciuri]PTJ60639.1 hypothetical protein BU009_03460 [Mammaliicoccus sciuri]
MNLRGHENRFKFLEKYDVTPISHLKILEGQKKDGEGGILTDSYYCFSYSLKGNSKKVLGTFNCGYHIAEDLLKLSNQDKLPLFNPFKVINEGNQLQEVANKGNLDINRQRKQYNEVALQLSNAINLIIFCYDGNIKEPLSTIKYETDKYYYSEPYDHKIKAVNTIIGKLFDKKLIVKISEFNGSQEIRNFDFSLLTDVIKKYEIQNNFE